MDETIYDNETWLHKVNPSLKFIFVIVLFTHLLWVDSLEYLLVFLMGCLLLYVAFTGHSMKRLALIAVPFLLIFITSSSSMILFGQGSTTWFSFGIVEITKESFYRGLFLGVRGVVFAALGVVFSLTTLPVRLFYSLMQQLKLKPKFAYSFMAAIRMVPLMVSEARNIQFALKVRGMHREKSISGIFTTLKAYSIPLLSQSIRRAHRMGVAMEAKGFNDAQKRTYYYRIGFSKYDFYFFLYFTGVIIFAFQITSTL
ncbi:energy-coupling factor transporter transmembrane protein EcfT [Halobacillus salinarum]|uniref:Energy-coupling factor transporter transmembrane protein EcfT n=1 Tax=Halobacillus salinarum TaxID=2932257 RepID=A0ABY4EDU8_9BACI|nr:energy-coupling factor transporter transmembrane component T [Halobacillus salinarum]UOQ42622.1 energy-coupling factor transporter transmembrane protein EcfT [Halobacillus salinarum]